MKDYLIENGVNEERVYQIGLLRGHDHNEVSAHPVSCFECIL